jgi:hypothetical protein
MHDKCHNLITAAPLCPDTLQYPILKEINVTSTSDKIEEQLNQLSRVGLETDLADCFLNLRSLICLIEYPRCNAITGETDKICETVRDQVMTKCVKKGGSGVDEKAWKSVIKDELFSRSNCFMGIDHKDAKGEDKSPSVSKPTAVPLEVHPVATETHKPKPTAITPSNSTAEVSRRCTPESYQINLLNGTCNDENDPPIVYFTTPHDPNCKDKEDLTKVQVPYTCPCHSKTLNIRTPCPKPRILTFHNPLPFSENPKFCNPISNNLISSFNTDTCTKNVEYYSNDLDDTGDLDAGLFITDSAVPKVISNRKRNQSDAGDGKSKVTPTDDLKTILTLIQDEQLAQLKDFSKSSCIPYQCSGTKNFLPPSLNHLKDKNLDIDCGSSDDKCDSIEISKENITFKATNTDVVPQLEFHLTSKSAQNYFLLELKTLSNPIYSGFRVFINNSPVTPLLTNVTEYKSLAINLPYTAGSASKNLNRIKIQHTLGNFTSSESIGAIKSILLMNCELNHHLENTVPFDYMKSLPNNAEAFDLSQIKLKASQVQIENQSSKSHGFLFWMIPAVVILGTIAIVIYFFLKAHRRNRAHNQGGEPMLMDAIKSKLPTGRGNRGVDPIETERLYDAENEGPAQILAEASSESDSDLEDVLVITKGTKNRRK